MQSLGEVLGSVTGAPLRAAVSTLQDDWTARNKALGAASDAFAQVPTQAPPWEDIIKKTGVDDERMQKILGFAAGIAEPGIPGLGAVMGGIKKGGKGAKTPGEVIDFAKVLREAGGPKPVDKLDQVHERLGKIIGLSDDTLPKAAKEAGYTKGFAENQAPAKTEGPKPGQRGYIDPEDMPKMKPNKNFKEFDLDPESDLAQYAEEIGVKIKRGSESTQSKRGMHSTLEEGDNFEERLSKLLEDAEKDNFKEIYIYDNRPTARIGAEKPVKQPVERSLRDQIIARYGDDSAKVEKALNKAAKTSEPYPTAHQTGWKQMPMPNFNYKIEDTVGAPKIQHSVRPNASGNDPLMWVDSKYEVVKNALRETKKPITINTSSDLIGRDDYAELIPEGSTVNLFALGENEHFNRLMFPGNPSNKRILAAYERLKERGVNVKLHKPTVEEYIEAAKDGANDKLENITGLTDAELIRTLRENGMASSRPKPVGPGGKKKP